MSKYRILKDNLKNVVGEEFEKTLPIIAEEYEAKSEDRQQKLQDH